jgi:hypothetical protein
MKRRRLVLRGRNVKGKLEDGMVVVGVDEGDAPRLSTSWVAANELLKERAGDAGANVDWQRPFRFSRVGSEVATLGAPLDLLGPEEQHLFQLETDAKAGELQCRSVEANSPAHRRPFGSLLFRWDELVQCGGTHLLDSF